MSELENALKSFNWQGTPVVTEKYGYGHINDTYLVACDSGKLYILQRINRAVFTKPDELMENIIAVTEYMAARTDDPRGTLHLVPLKNGSKYYVDSEQQYWRAYDFITDSICLQQAETEEDFYQSAVAFGGFQKTLADFPAVKLYEVIPDFHNTVNRYALFHEAITRNAAGRVSYCKREIDFYLSREQEAGCIVDLLKSGQLPLRVTHNDTKLNNVMLDYKTRKALCIIDLDTTMPGSALYDYGDSIRFGAATAKEDEQDLTKVSMSTSLFRTYTRGFLLACGDSLTELEIRMLPIGAKMMTLECGLRFLTDYLNGDTYFKVHRENHNLDRARTQMTLVKDMEAKMEQMNTIVQEVRQ